MAEYIDRMELLSIESLLMTKYIEKNKVALWLYEQMMHDIKEHPVADVAPVVHGKNITDMHPVDEFICSQCGIDLTEFCRYDPEEDVSYEYKFKYCPECGAKMDLEE